MSDKIPKATISKYMASLNAKRKNKVGGFSDPKILRKAIETRRKNNANKQTIGGENSTTSQDSPQSQNRTGTV